MLPRDVQEEHYFLLNEGTFEPGLLEDLLDYPRLSGLFLVVVYSVSCFRRAVFFMPDEMDVDWLKVAVGKGCWFFYARFAPDLCPICTRFMPACARYMPEHFRFMPDLCPIYFRQLNRNF